MLIKGMTKEALEKFIETFKRWSGEMKYNESDGGLYDISITTKVPFLFKFNSLTEPVFEVGSSYYVLNRSDFFTINIF